MAKRVERERLDVNCFAVPASRLAFVVLFSNPSQAFAFWRFTLAGSMWPLRVA
jgi:hypothetical protein